MRRNSTMVLLFVMLVATGSAVVIDRGLAWWRGNRWRRVARRAHADTRGGEL